MVVAFLVRPQVFCLRMLNSWRAQHRFGRAGRPRPADREPLQASRRCPYLQNIIIKQSVTVFSLVIRGRQSRDLAGANTIASERYASNTKPRLYIMRRSEGEPPYRRQSRHYKVENVISVRVVGRQPQGISPLRYRFGRNDAKKR